MANRRNDCEKICIQSWCLLQLPTGRLWFSGADHDSRIKTLFNKQKYVVLNMEIVF